jgi:hypothetical protein
MIREAIEKLDMKFIADAEHCSSFNIRAKEFESLDNKEEIRHIITVNWFGGEAIPRYEKFNRENFEKGIKYLRGKNSKSFEKLFYYKPLGMGPGEVLGYVLFDDVTCGGQGSKAVDLISGTDMYEMKGCVITQKSDFYGSGPFISNFKMGGTKRVDELVTRIYKFKENIRDQLPKKLQNYKEVGTSIFAWMKDIDPKEWKSIEKEFQKIAFDYFESQNLIGIVTKPSSGVSIGDILIFGPIKKSNILLGNVTGGGFKPMIRLEN